MNPERTPEEQAEQDRRAELQRLAQREADLRESPVFERLYRERTSEDDPGEQWVPRDPFLLIKDLQSRIGFEQRAAELRRKQELETLGLCCGTLCDHCAVGIPARKESLGAYGHWVVEKKPLPPKIVRELTKRGVPVPEEDIRVWRACTASKLWIAFEPRLAIVAINPGAIPDAYPTPYGEK